jgi:hypothetical protein
MSHFRFAKAETHGTAPVTLDIVLPVPSGVSLDTFYATEAATLVHQLAHTLPRGTMVAVCRELVRRYPTAMRAALSLEE